MKKLFAIVAILAVVASASSVVLAQTGTDPDTVGDVKTTGNGAPAGAHYNLNIIGVSKDKTADMTGDNGHRIFVPLEGKAKILLAEGEEFAVLDANGTDANGAKFQLPNPDPDGNGTTEYSVYVRALGKPGGSAIMQSCYTEGDEEWCAVDFDGGVEPIEVSRGKGKSTFTNVSKDLLYVDYCTDWNLTDPENPVCLHTTQIPLFGDETLGYLWDYDNNGLKVAQLRFYEVQTVTPWTPEL